MGNKQTIFTDEQLDAYQVSWFLSPHDLDEGKIQFDQLSEKIILNDTIYSLFYSYPSEVCSVIILLLVWQSKKALKKKNCVIKTKKEKCNW